MPFTLVLLFGLSVLAPGVGVPVPLAAVEIILFVNRPKSENSMRLNSKFNSFCIFRRFIILRAKNTLKIKLDLKIYF